MYLDKVYAKKRKIKKEGLWGFTLSLGPVLGFALFGLVPMILAIFMSFMHIEGFSFEGATFIGFENYSTVLKDPLFWKSIVNTLYMRESTFINIALALVVAFLLTKNIRGKKIFRTIYFIPYVCSVAAIAVMWQWIFNTNYGVINGLFTPEGKDPINWWGDADTFIPCLLIIGVWSGTGYGIILYGAALTNVNSSLYEAAKVDGANAFQCFKNITLPAISPTTFYLLLTGLIGALQEFARPQIIDGSGGPNNVGVTVVFYLYRNAFQYYNMGVASATAWLLAIIIVALTIVNFAVSKLWVNYD